ncbi:hypothetical protein OS125_10000 [Corynebacterium sp. P7003]|uniref:DUF4013 domain-containing protein n=1 Tax=Corynebacterium pygosceleis TaxID=2800406 RepID=A0ABT3WTQ2_9CORY|nr:hypothetical protein [Corynebacterium pygosceleis]MCX7445571.1 hypothetical protein [Corynebacterium pygosceleis]
MEVNTVPVVIERVLDFLQGFPVEIMAVIELAVLVVAVITFRRFRAKSPDPVPCGRPTEHRHLLVRTITYSDFSRSLIPLVVTTLFPFLILVLAVGLIPAGLFIGGGSGVLPLMFLVINLMAVPSAFIFYFWLVTERVWREIPEGDKDTLIHEWNRVFAIGVYALTLVISLLCYQWSRGGDLFVFGDSVKALFTLIIAVYSFEMTRLAASIYSQLSVRV